MNTAQPIRKQEDLDYMKSYYRTIYPNARNQLLIVMGLNTALRISDILGLCWKDVYQFETGCMKEHLLLTEQKTKKFSSIFLNENIREALTSYKEDLQEKKKEIFPELHLFVSRRSENSPISRVQAYRIIKEIAANCSSAEVISCHSLRKTFGYHAWKQGVQPALLMDIYNHSSFQVTQRYLGIEQDDRDEIFKNINI